MWRGVWRGVVVFSGGSVLYGRLCSVSVSCSVVGMAVVQRVVWFWWVLLFAAWLVCVLGGRGGVGGREFEGLRCSREGGLLALLVLCESENGLQHPAIQRVLEELVGESAL